MQKKRMLKGLSAYYNFIMLYKFEAEHKYTFEDSLLRFIYVRQPKT